MDWIESTNVQRLHNDENLILVTMEGSARIREKKYDQSFLVV